MSLIEFFAGVGYLIVDICAFCSLIGSSVILLASLFGRSPKRLPEQVWMWSMGGLVFGCIFWLSLVWSNAYPAKTFLLGLTLYNVALCLVLSFTLLLVSLSVRKTRHQR